MKKKRILRSLFVLIIAVMLSLVCSAAASSQKNGYEYWKAAGERAGAEAVAMIKQKNSAVKSENLIAMTNAGYAEIRGQSTMGYIDGLTMVTHTRRGNHTLLEIHSHYDAPLWCAVYDKHSGNCAYLQFDSAKIFGDIQKVPASEMFAVAAVERIDAEHLYANAEASNKKFADKIFGGNEFRIVTILNAVAKDAPAYAVRAFEFHDHYCPGVTSGIVMVNYVKKHFPLTPGGSYFVQSVQPWCKEDALITLLNATPGKRGYSVLYSTEADRAAWKEEAKQAATIVYRQDSATKKWDGIVLGFDWDRDTGCPDYGKRSILNKLCQDLWYLEKMDQPEDFVKVIKTFEVPEGQTPRDWAKPGADPMKLLKLAE